MLKKMLLLVSAVAALAALSPAVASATWFMEGKAITKNESLQVKGSAAFEGETGGIKCNMVAEGSLTAGTTTGTTQFAVDGTPTAACVTQGLLALAGCKVETVQITGLPWTVHKTSTQTIDVTTGAIHNTLVKSTGAACTPHTITLDAGTVSLHVLEAEMNAISKGTLSGTLQSSIGEVEVEGSGNVTPAGTFGL